MALPAPPRKKWKDWVNRPWTRRARARRNVRFRRWLWRHGYLTPNFTRAEYRCHDSQGSEVWGVLKYRARQHCFQLERFRHAVGDKSMPILSGYRTPAYNRQIGGASQSRHMSGDATDFSTTVLNRIGTVKFFSVADVIFRDDGVGRYPSGSGHLDSRGYRARWTSF